MFGLITWLTMTAGQAALPADQYLCILRALTPEEQAEISRTAQRGEAPTAPMIGHLRAIVADCGTRFGWDNERAAAMATRTTTAIVRREVEASLTRQGLEPQRIEHWLARQSDQVQTNIPFEAADIDRLLADLSGEGISRDVLHSNSSLIGALLATLIVINRLDRGLPL